jgi:hypothetical protein
MTGSPNWHITGDWSITAAALSACPLHLRSTARQWLLRVGPLLARTGPAGPVSRCPLIGGKPEVTGRRSKRRD